MSDRLTHVDESGAARMVDVSGKDVTQRTATATGRVLVAPRVVELLRGLGMTTVFGNPGSTEIPFLGEWPNSLRYVLGLQEASVVAMADGYARASGRAAFCNLHSAAGVGHALGNVFTAHRNNAPLVITAKSWKNAAGLPQVDFSPSLRFNPNAGADVTLFLRVTSSKKLRSSPTILYCAAVAAACVDEQLVDPSLATHVDRQNSFAYRRIKHFSGYNVSSGRSMAEALDF